MATDLIDTVKSYLTPEVTQKLATLVGESPANTREAMDSGIPTLLAGLTNFASTGDGATQLTNMINRGDYGNILNNLSSLLSGGNATQSMLSTGRDLLGTLFGGRLSAVIDLLANATGLKSSSTSSLLSLAAPLILGILGKQGLSPTSLLSLLTGQKDLLTRLVPAGLAGILGTNQGTTRYTDAPAYVPPDRITRVGSGAVQRAGVPWKWLLPVLGLLGLWLLYSLFGRGTAVREEPVARQGAVARPLATVTLPGGVTVAVREGSFNYNLARYLADPSGTVPRTFVFDSLNFESGTTQLTPDSAQTVTDLIAILKAYPTTEVRLEGHTDSTGEAAANKQLSLARAEAVKSMMVRGGIDASRMSTAGYGQENPIASNATEDGKAQNRRLELVVAKK
jgi:OOP family OmpA-OmpF porin